MDDRNGCPCSSCRNGLTNNIHLNKDYFLKAAIIKRSVDWNKMPRLREIFENRPGENIYWGELVHLIQEASKIIGDHS